MRGGKFERALADYSSGKEGVSRTMQVMVIYVESSHQQQVHDNGESFDNIKNNNNNNSNKTMQVVGMSGESFHQ